MIGLLIALYPAHWRRRYGDEFRAVLEMRPMGPFDVADVLLGALDARLALRRKSEGGLGNGGHRMLLRVGGLGAILGGGLWVAGFLGGSVVRDDKALWGLLMMGGTAGILVALVGLSAFQAHRNPWLAWFAFLIPGFGSLVSILGLYGMLTMADTEAPMLAGIDPWSIWAVGTLATIIGCVLFAVATYQAAVLSRRGAAGLAISSVLILGMALGVDGSAPAAGGVAIALPLVLVGFAASWALLGVNALRRGPIRAIAGA